MAHDNKPRFIRKHGRIIPIGGKRKAGSKAPDPKKKTKITKKKKSDKKIGLKGK